MRTFDPKNKDLISIFSDSNRYEVPRFQRGYDWGMEQIENFWLDIESVNQKSKDSVFFGNFIFLNNDPEKKVLTIIDGQQRITTLQILLIAIRTRSKELNDDPLQISSVNNLIEYVTNKFSKQERTGLKKLTSSKTIRPLFEIMSDYKWDGVIPEKIQGLDGRTYRKIKNKIQPLYEFFYEKVKDKNTQDLAEVLLSLENMFVTTIEISDPIEAFDIFERTNGRGVKLAQSDLVKNLLFQNADESIHDEIDKKWDSITLHCSENLSQLLKYYVISFNGKTLKKEIFPILNNLVKNKTSESLINELMQFSLFYKTMSDEGTSSSESSTLSLYLKEIDFLSLIEDASRKKSLIRSINSFQLFKITQIYPLIYAYIGALRRVNSEIEELNKDQKNKKYSAEFLLNFIKRLENFHFVNTVIGKNIGNQVESLYSEFSRKFNHIGNVNDFTELEKDFKEKILDIREKRKTFISKFSQVNYDDDDGKLIVYIFDRISNAESKGDQIYPLYNPDKTVKTKTANIEHFYPRKLFEDPNDLIGIESGNNIGNLLVVPLHTNSAFQHGLPSDKFNLIKEDSKHLINIGNRDLLLMKYSDKIWNKDLIDSRAEDLACYGFDVVWNINI